MSWCDKYLFWFQLNIHYCNTHNRYTFSGPFRFLILLFFAKLLCTVYWPRTQVTASNCKTVAFSWIEERAPYRDPIFYIWLTPITPYGIIELGHYCLSWWLVARRHQAITKPFSVKSKDIRKRQLSHHSPAWKLVIFDSNLPETSELTCHSYVIWWHSLSNVIIPILPLRCNWSQVIHGSQFLRPADKNVYITDYC